MLPPGNEQLLRLWLERPDRFRVESGRSVGDDLQKHDLEIRDGERWWRAHRLGSDSEWQSPEWLSSQEPTIAKGWIGDGCDRLLDPWPLLADMLRTAGACEPLGREMVAGREAIRLRWTRPVDEEPEVFPSVVGGELIGHSMTGPGRLGSVIPLGVSEVEVAVDAERGVLLRSAESDIWCWGRQVEFVEVVFDEPLEPDTFRPSWTTSEGTSIYSDALTGLLNPRCFSETLAREITSAQDRDKPLALLLIDIDDLEQVNDNFGPRLGSMVLTEIAQSIKALVRPSDIPCRTMGPDFAVILPESGVELAGQFYDYVRDEISVQPVVHTKEIGISGGVAELRSEEDADSLDQRVHDALRRAKDEGGNRRSD
jgi:diguanylate cyclase (GGDEF)-like protein